MAKSAYERLKDSKPPKYVVLEKDFAGVKKGQKLFIANPQIIDDYMRSIPFGETRRIERMRRELARQNQCDASCPVSTAIFIRVAAQAAIDQMNDGTPENDITPFWRLLDANEKIAKKLTIDGNWITHKRQSEK